MASFVIFAISLWREVVPPLLKLFINLHRTNKKLPRKVEQYRFSAVVSEILRYRQTDTMLLYHKDFPFVIFICISY